MAALSLVPSIPAQRVHTDRSMQCMLSTMAVLLSGQGIESQLKRRLEEKKVAPALYQKGEYWQRIGSMAGAADLQCEINALQEALRGVPLGKSNAFRILRAWYDEALTMYLSMPVVK